MDVALVETRPEGVEADVLAFAVADPVELPGPAQELDRRLDGRLARLAAEGELTGKRGALTLLHTSHEVAAKRVAAVGIGERGAVDPDDVRTGAAEAAARAEGIGAATLAWLLDEGGSALPAREQVRAVVEGVALGTYDTGRWKTDGARPRSLECLVVSGRDAHTLADEAGRANVIAAWTNRCRDVVNAPPNELTPARLADFADEVAESSPSVRFQALGEDEISAAGMGAFAAVARGSEIPPRLVTLSYEPPDGSRADLVLGLVGKALTFDAGGISLKPPDGLEEMKADMGGGAAVIAALGAIAALRVPLRILAVVPACENMPGGAAYRPGDILTALNGKTIEVTNTDAEGRLILADALSYARGQGATHLLDLATLTGTIVVAMGDFYAGLFGNDREWLEEIRAAAERSGDHAWPMPLHRSYARHLESAFADLKNCPEKRRGSSIIAALFLEEFAGEGPWAHLDIAGTAFLDRGRDYYRQMGATGYGVRLVAELADRLAR
ncbi:MAG: leucyl aminopeptidase [Actinomycetota bacterium]|nr:leucyl aminopeptidase [Actinomycetota bacterium]